MTQFIGEEYFHEADLRDIQVIMSFNPRIMEQVVKGDAIDFTRIKSIRELQTPDDLQRYVIATSNQDTLVNFSYSLFGNGDSLNGSVELIDNDGMLFSFIKQSFLRNEGFFFYFIWGYGKNRYHWSLVHKVIISDINYNLHEGNKVVNIHFTPIISDRNSRNEIYTAVPIKVATSYDVRTKSFLVNDAGKRRSEKEFIITTSDKRKEQVVADLIEEAAKHCFKYGLQSNLSVVVDKEKIVESLRSSNWFYTKSARKVVEPRFGRGATIIARTFSEEDLYWQIFCSEIGGINYSKDISKDKLDNMFGGRFSPGSASYKEGTVLPKSFNIQDIEAEYDKKIEDQRKILLRLKSSIDKRLPPVGDPLYDKSKAFYYSDSTSEGAAYNATLKTINRIEQEKKSIFANLMYEGDFPLLIFNKPSGVAPIPFFRKFLKALNTRLGLNLKYAFSDVGKTPTVFIGEDLARANQVGVDMISSNKNKRLYSGRTGLRLIKSINPRGYKLIEDQYDSSLTLTYNVDETSIIEKLTVDVVFTEFFNWVGRVLNLNSNHPNVNSEKDVESYNTNDLAPLARALSTYYNRYRGNINKEDESSIISFINAINKKGPSPLKKEEVVVSLDKKLVRDIREYINRNRAAILQALSQDLVESEHRFVTVQVSVPGIPELDEFNNLNFGRAVYLEVNDPSPTPNEEKITFLSGKYFIKGIKHEILMGSGYTTYISLFKAFDETLFPEGLDDL